MLGGVANEWAVTVAFVFGLLGLLTYMTLCVILFLRKNEDGYDYFVKNGQESHKSIFIGGHAILFLSMLVLFYSKKESVNRMMRKVGEIEKNDTKMKHSFEKQIFNMIINIVSTSSARKFILWILFMSSFFLLLLNAAVGGQAPYPVSFVGSFTPTLMIVLFCWIYVYCQQILHEKFFSDTKQFPLQKQWNYKIMKKMKWWLLMCVIFTGAGFVLLHVIGSKQLAVFFQLAAILLLCTLGLLMCWDHHNTKEIKYMTGDDPKP